jgi:glutamyl/glutaminyl-tRNA synthetase
MDKNNYQKKSIIKNKKLQPINKQDKKIINDIIDLVDNDKESWIDLISKLDSDILFRSMAHILNDEFDNFPQKLIDLNPDLKCIDRNLTIFDVLSNSDTLFRFAPSPSGHLHVGHFVPILTNILLRQISRSHSRQSDLILRIDDTNPDEDDFSQEIINSINKLLRNSNEYILTRSSDMADQVVSLIDQSIMQGDNKFYVDETDQETIKYERTERIENKYRQMNIDSQKELWNKMKQMELPNVVVRAKIDMKSDNGNLRDPVMIRIVNIGLNKKLMPTYDLICPVLDSIDSDNISKKSNKFQIMIALRDANYFDRKEQYYWIQSALNLTPTAIITFSRVNFEGVLLSKRKIKKLIGNGKVSPLFENLHNPWFDPRLMTIEGLFNRGMTLGGLLHFYWLTGHISTGNRITSQDLDTFFSSNDKVLSQKNNFIVDRMPAKFIPSSDESDKYMLLKIFKCVNNKEIDSIPDLICIQSLYCLKKRLITTNLKFLKELNSLNISSDDLNEGDEVLKKHVDKIDLKNFKLCSDLKVGENIKINNFKDIDDDPDFGGFYHILNVSDSVINVINIS